MRTAAIEGKVATWLELAVAPDWRRNGFKVRVHAIGESGGCFAISMNERWVCSGTGGLTVFHGLEAARHFLALLHITDFEQGEAADPVLSGRAHRYCLCTDVRNMLLPCTCREGKAAH